MLRGWLVGLAVFACVGLSVAAQTSSSLIKEKQWEEARNYLAEGKAAEAKAVFEALLRRYPRGSRPPSVCRYYAAETPRSASRGILREKGDCHRSRSR